MSPLLWSAQRLPVKLGPQRVTQDGAREVGAVALSEDSVGHVDPLDYLRVGLVARPIAGCHVRVGGRVRNCVTVEAHSNSQHVYADGGAHWSQALYIGILAHRR